MESFYPAAQGIQNPDILKAYITGQQAPLQTELMRQAVSEGPLRLQQLQMAMQSQGMRNQLAQQELQAGNQPQAPQMPGAMPNVQQGQPQPQQWGPPGGQGYSSPLDAMVTPERLAAGARLGRFDAITKGGDPNKPLMDAMSLQENVRKDQEQRAKMAADPYLTSSKMLSESDNPQALLFGNENLMKLWASYAGHVGGDPLDFRDAAKIRQAATFAYNDLASKVGQPGMSLPNQMKDEQGPRGSLLQRDPVTNKLTSVVGAEPAGLLASNTPPRAPGDPEVESYKSQIIAGNATLQNVPMNLRGSVALALDATSKGQFTPTAASKYTMAANRITHQFTDMSAYKLTRDGKPYLERIDAAMQNPGSVSDQDLLDSLTKLNTGGNAVTEAQVSLITHGKSFADAAQTFANKFKNGGVLSPDQRQQIHDIAYQIYDNYQKGYQPIYEQASKQLTEAGIPKAFWTIPDLNTINGPPKLNGGNQAPAAAIEHLRQNPALAEQFKAKYGYLPDGR